MMCCILYFGTSASVWVAVWMAEVDYSEQDGTNGNLRSMEFCRQADHTPWSWRMSAAVKDSQERALSHSVFQMPCLSQFFERLRGTNTFRENFVVCAVRFSWQTGSVALSTKLSQHLGRLWSRNLLRRYQHRGITSFREHSLRKSKIANPSHSRIPPTEHCLKPAPSRLMRRLESRAAY